MEEIRLRMLLFSFFGCLVLLSCNSGTENVGNPQLTATLNGEEWVFVDVATERTAEGLEITGLGYLNGDETTAPVNLQIKVIDIPEEGEITTPYAAFFAPGTVDAAAIATIIPEGLPTVYETELDPNAQGQLVVTEVDENSISGEFNFIATDQSGQSITVSNGEFNNLPL